MGVDLALATSWWDFLEAICPQLVTVTSDAQGELIAEHPFFAAHPPLDWDYWLVWLGEPSHKPETDVVWPLPKQAEYYRGSWAPTLTTGQLWRHERALGAVQDHMTLMRDYYRSQSHVGNACYDAEHELERARWEARVGRSWLQRRIAEVHRQAG